MKGVLNQRMIKQLNIKSHLLYPKQNNIYEKDTPSVDDYKDFNWTKLFFVGSVLVVYSYTISEHFVSDYHFF